MKFLLLWFLTLSVVSPVMDFKNSQLRYPRVQQAYKDKNPEIDRLLNRDKILRGSMEIFIRIFKQEKTVELWAKNKTDKKFILLTSFPFCASSGDLGPKRGQGDSQTPEGFYFINTFNPSSNYYLSLGINYPNPSDKILSHEKNPGGDIFIHGNCVTIGCIPITDDKIKELYIFTVEARNNGQDNIPVHIFPMPLTEENLVILGQHYKTEPGKLSFWKNLKEGYELFEKTSTIPVVSVSKDGAYHYFR